MSTVKANNAQIGQSVTATNNFTLYQPASPDGTVRLGVGNAGATTSDVITATNAGNVTIAGSLTAASIAGVTVAVANGGTGQTTYTNGQLLIGNTTGNTLTKATLTAGTGISVTNGTGSITIASTVTSLPGAQGQAFTSSGTFTIPSGVTAIKMTIVGGGGAGGAGNAGGYPVGGGGGGGGAAIKYLTGLTPGNTLTVTVGAAGGTSSVASGTQSITTVSATGGTAGTSGASSGAGGAGGLGSSGDLNIGGSAGGTIFSPSVGCTSLGISGLGGASIFGGGGTNASFTGGTVGAGRAYGGGGGGGSSSAGGAGAAGVVLIEW
jgi:hypothetical protein